MTLNKYVIMCYQGKKAIDYMEMAETLQGTRFAYEEKGASRNQKHFMKTVIAKRFG